MCCERPNICLTRGVAVDGPEMEPRAGASGDVARQIVDVNGGQRRVVSAQLADECETRQVPDDGRPVARTRHEDLVAGRSGQTRDGLCVAVEVLPDGKLFLAQVPDGDDRIGSARHDGPSCGADAGENLLVVERRLADHQGLVRVVRNQMDRVIRVAPGDAANEIGRSVWASVRN